MRTRWLALPVLAILAAVALSALAGAHLAGPQVVTVSKTKGGPAIENRQTVTNKAKTYWTRVENVSNHQLSIAMDDRSAQDPHGDFNIRWFRGKHEVTHQLNHGGLKFDLNPGKHKDFRANVKPLVGNPGELCLAPGTFSQPDAADRVGIVYINSNSICG